MDEIRTTKIQVAGRQLDAAIGMLFADGDLVAAHTLAGAAAKILSDLEPDQSSDRHAQQVVGGEATYRDVARAAQNLLKDVNPNPDVTRAFSANETVALISAAILNLYELGGRITIPQSVFHLWLLACRFDALDESFQHREMIKAEFGNLARRTWHYQIAMGRVALEKGNAIARGAASGG